MKCLTSFDKRGSLQNGIYINVFSLLYFCYAIYSVWVSAVYTCQHRHGCQHACTWQVGFNNHQHLLAMKAYYREYENEHQ